MNIASQGGSTHWFSVRVPGYESPRPVTPGEYFESEQLCDRKVEETFGHPT